MTAGNSLALNIVFLGKCKKNSRQNDRLNFPWLIIISILTSITDFPSYMTILLPREIIGMYFAHSR